MLVSTCYLHWRTKKTVLEVSLERNKSDSKGGTHLKSHSALWFHLWVKQPLPVCLFCCVSPSKHCHESPPPLLFPLLLFSSLLLLLSFLPVLCFWISTSLTSFPAARTCCGRGDETKRRTRASFPDRRVQPGVQQRKAASLFPQRAAPHPFPFVLLLGTKTTQQDKSNDLLSFSWAFSTHSLSHLGRPLYFSFCRAQFVNRSRLM